MRWRGLSKLSEMEGLDSSFNNISKNNLAQTIQALTSLQSDGPGNSADEAARRQRDESDAVIAGL